jgi:membrane-associated phospholipid phosphatase
VIGVGRLRIGAHWPSDIVGGAVLGVVWLSALVLSLRHAHVLRQGIVRSAPASSPRSRPPLRRRVG